MVVSTTLAILMALHAFAAAKAQSGSGVALVKAGTELTMGDRSLPDPLYPYANLKLASLAANSPIKQTSGCATVEDWAPVLMAEPLWRSVAPLVGRTKSMAGVLPVEHGKVCVQVGVPFAVAKLDSNGTGSVLLGWFMPTAIVASRADFEIQEAALMVAAGMPRNINKSTVAFISGRVVSSVQSSLVEIPAPSLEGVKFISRDQVETAIADGVQIVDVRSRKQFDLTHVKGAISLPADKISEKARIDNQSVGTDVNKPVIVMAESFQSKGAVKAAKALAESGWKKVFVFYEGFNFFAGMAPQPPSTSQVVNVISAAELAELLSLSSSASVVLDARDPSEFKQLTIAGAKNAPVVERDDLRLQRRGLDGRTLIEYGDTIKLPAENSKAPKSLPIVVFGSDATDWRAYKAALMLKAQGYSSVSWFRMGVGAWQLRSTENSERFPIESAPRN